MDSHTTGMVLWSTVHGIRQTPAADVTAICFDPTECAIYTAYEKAFKWSWVR